MKIIKLIYKYILIFLIGGCAYYYTEVAVRGWSHWSMFILGGICFEFFSLQKMATWWNQSIFCQISRCLLFLLAGEFITGCMVNLWKGWNIWDYSQVPINLCGQICFPMAVIFSVLCYIGIIVDDWIQVNAFGKIKKE